jgi:uncharacterized protein (TIGR00106 family)
MSNNVIAEISVVPIGTASTSLSKFVAGCDAILENTKGLNYRLTAMGTVVEGPLDLILSLVKQMHEAPFNQGVFRVLTTIKIDDRRDRDASMDKKLESVLKVNPDIKTDKS